MAGVEIAAALQRASLLRPQRRRARRRLREVEGDLRRLHVRGRQRGDALEPVRRVRAAKGQAPVDAHARRAAVAPPHEALRPVVRLLHGAEPEGRLGVDHVRLRARRVAARRVADGDAPAEVLHRREEDLPLGCRHAGVHGTIASVAGVLGHAGLQVKLDDRLEGPVAPLPRPVAAEHPRLLLHDHVSGQNAARDEGQVAHRRRDPLLGDFAADHLRRRGGGVEQAPVVEGEYRVEGAVGARLDAPLAHLLHDVHVVPTELRGREAKRRAIDLPHTREDGVARGALDRLARAWVAAVPHDSSRPRLEPILAEWARDAPPHPAPACALRRRRCRTIATLRWRKCRRRGRGRRYR
eukprot:7001773-Prymnesium_polylepis.1